MRRWAIALGLTVVAAGGLTSTITVAASPTLRMDCSTPNHQELIGCRLSGTGFQPSERLRITYRITFTALPRRHGRFPEKVVIRGARSDARGAMARPPLTFSVVRFHESYRLKVTVVGVAGDRASLTTVGIAQ